MLRTARRTASKRKLDVRGRYDLMQYYCQSTLVSAFIFLGIDHNSCPCLILYSKQGFLKDWLSGGNRVNTFMPPQDIRFTCTAIDVGRKRERESQREREGERERERERK